MAVPFFCASQHFDIMQRLPIFCVSTASAPPPAPVALHPLIAPEGSHGCRESDSERRPALGLSKCMNNVWYIYAYRNERHHTEEESICTTTRRRNQGCPCAGCPGAGSLSLPRILVNTTYESPDHTTNLTCNGTTCSHHLIPSDTQNQGKPSSCSTINKSKP